MRNWLQTRAEEEKRRQEEEKRKQEEERTRQESLRLEQRRIEAEILRSSLGGGIPPPMVPLVFAGMGGGGVLSQVALDWAQQFMPPGQSHHLQLMGSQSAVASHHQREQANLVQGQYAAPAAQGLVAAYTAPPGTPNRSRAQSTSGSLSHPMAHASNHPSSSTNFVGGGGNAASTHQAPSQLQSQASQQDSSPSLYFHHWQPPTSHAGSNLNRPGTPSGSLSTSAKMGRL